jgi:serralysin
MTKCASVHWINKILPGLLLGQFLVLSSCLFQDEDSGRPGIDKAAYPGPCFDLIDENDDGSAEWKWVFAYDDRGNRISSTLFSIPDEDGGRTDSWSYTYDAKGNIQVKTEDVLSDGRVDSRLTYVRDAQGRILRSEGEQGLDSVMRWVTIFTYDGNGNKTSEKYDYGLDGTFENIHILTYNAKGDTLVHVIGDDRDGNGEMRVDRTATYTYDAKGNRLTYLLEGNIEAQYTYHYTFDSHGYPSTRETRYYGGLLVLLTRYVYDAAGRRLAEENDENGDGTVEEKYAWDGDGNLLLMAMDGDKDGVLEWAYQFTYDISGNRLTTVIDSALDGVVEERITASYECWKTD